MNSDGPIPNAKQNPLVGGLGNDSGGVQSILRERARRLAEPLVSEEKTSGGTEFLVFRLDEEPYALETRFVRKVFQPTEIAPVPRTEEFFLGVTNLHGEVLAVMDLSRFLSRGKSAQTEWVLVLGEDRAEFGVAATHVDEVRSLKEEAIKPQAKVTSSAADWIQGMTSDAVTVLDGENLLADPRLVIDE